MFEATTLPAGVTMAPVTIEPGADGSLEVIASDAALSSPSQLVLATNDPGQATVTVVLGRDIGGTHTDGDEDAHGGCNAGGGGAGLVLAFAALGLRRRRRS